MPAITKFDRTNAKAIQAEVTAALQAIGVKYGLKVDPAGGTIGDTEFTAKVRFTVTDKAATEIAQRAEFNSLCRIFGLEPSHYGATFNNNGETWKVTGFSRSGKFPIEAENATTGKKMRFSDMAVQLIKRAA